jgi:hypothetical protein
MTDNSNKTHEKIHIFINNVKFDQDNGVKPTMTGRELAQLAKVPENNASITRKDSDVQIGLDESVPIKNGDHFEIIRDRVEAGFSDPASLPLYVQRIEKELDRLYKNSNVKGDYVKVGDQEFIIYRDIQTSGKTLGLEETIDVLTRVPAGYPTALIDMPAVPKDSKLLEHVVGYSNPQGEVTVDGKVWVFVSYHPYNSGQGGLDWNPSLHGFDHYAIELYMWLHKLK